MMLLLILLISTTLTSASLVVDQFNPSYYYSNSPENKLLQLIDKVNGGTQCGGGGLGGGGGRYGSNSLYGSSAATTATRTRNIGSGSYLVPVAALDPGSSLTPSSRIERESVITLDDFLTGEQDANLTLPIQAHYARTQYRTDLVAQILASYRTLAPPGGGGDEQLRARLERQAITELLSNDQSIVRLRFALLSAAPPSNIPLTSTGRSRSPRSAPWTPPASSIPPSSSSSLSSSSSSSGSSISSASSSELSNENFLTQLTLLSTLLESSTATANQQEVLDLASSSSDESDSSESLSPPAPPPSPDPSSSPTATTSQYSSSNNVRRHVRQSSSSAATSSLLPHRSIAAKVEETVQATLFATYYNDNRQIYPIQSDGFGHVAGHSVREQRNISFPLTVPWLPRASRLPTLVKQRRFVVTPSPPPLSSSGPAMPERSNHLNPYIPPIPTSHQRLTVRLPPLPPPPLPVERDTAAWSSVYYNCELHLWLVSYTALLVDSPTSGDSRLVVGFISIDINATHTDINQCDGETDLSPSGANDQSSGPTVLALRGTHQCDNQTSRCVHQSSSGWRTGSYLCECRPGYYPKRIDDGTEIGERATHCARCPPGCETCTSSRPCLTEPSMPLTVTLLTITLVTLAWSVTLTGGVLLFRRQLVIKTSSPPLLCITLLGAVIAYCELVVILMPLSHTSVTGNNHWTHCILINVTRHAGVCLAFTPLILKVWRVRLTFRCKSAHRVRLTTSQLIHYLGRLVLGLVVYLAAWSISSPTLPVYHTSPVSGLKYLVCPGNWWNHSLIMAELACLLWACKMCYSIRRADSPFNESWYITRAVWCVTLLYLVMVVGPLCQLTDWFTPESLEPDTSRLVDFFRVHLTISLTLAAVFMPKVVSLARGEGNKQWVQHDIRNPVLAATGLGSLMGAGGGGGGGGITAIYEMADEKDVFQENELLKEQVTKLAAKVELMKIAHMEVNNRHLKRKVSSPSR